MAHLRLLMVTPMLCLLRVPSQDKEINSPVQQNVLHPPPKVDPLLSIRGVDDINATVPEADGDESESGLAQMQDYALLNTGQDRLKAREMHDRKCSRDDHSISSRLQRAQQNGMLRRQDRDEDDEWEGRTQLDIIPPLTHDEVAQSQWEGRERVVKILVVIGLVVWLAIFRGVH